MTTTPPPTPKPRRRWLQFRLRTLMVVVLLVGSSMGWFVHKRLLPSRLSGLENWGGRASRSCQ